MKWIIYSLWFVGTAQASTLSVSDAWLREPPPGSKISALYLKIKNTDKKEQQIVAVSSEAFETIEIHQTVEKNGMMSMKKKSALRVPSGKTVVLRPGGWHLMLIGLKSKLKKEAVFELLTKSGRKIKFKAEVKRPDSNHSGSGTKSPHNGSHSNGSHHRD